MAIVENLKGIGRYTEDHFLVTNGKFRDVCRSNFLQETIEAVDDAHIQHTLELIAGTTQETEENKVAVSDDRSWRLGRYYTPYNPEQTTIYYQRRDI